MECLQLGKQEVWFCKRHEAIQQDVSKGGACVEQAGFELSCFTAASEKTGTSWGSEPRAPHTVSNESHFQAPKVTLKSMKAVVSKMIPFHRHTVVIQWQCDCVLSCVVMAGVFLTPLYLSSVMRTLTI